MDERTLAFLRELERADAEAASVLAELDALAVDVETVRIEARAVLEREVSLPPELTAAEEAGAGLEGEVEERREAHARAADDLARAGEDEAGAAAARRAELRARDLLRSAERRLEATLAKVERLRAEGEELRGRRAAVLARARELAAALAERPGLGDAGSPPPGDSLEAVAAWATEARAGVLVGRAGLVSRREAVIRQANELGSAVLGEPLLALSPAAVARRFASRAD